VVTANVRDRDIASVVGDARAQVDAQVKLPAGYWMTWGGQFENLEAARQCLSIVVPACFLVIFLLLMSALRSARDALLVFSAVPLALTGGVLAPFAAQRLGLLLALGRASLLTAFLAGFGRAIAEVGLNQDWIRIGKLAGCA
jgi:Cu/Ag efflux pump CusA